MYREKVIRSGWLVEVLVLGCFDADLLGHGDQMLSPKLQRRWMIRRSDDQRMA
jgi:hypothetical protein